MYSLAVPEHITDGPLIVFGEVGVDVQDTTVKPLCEEVQLPFEAVTITEPVVELDIVFIVSVVDVPDQPFGNVQLYEVAR